QLGRLQQNLADPVFRTASNIILFDSTTGQTDNTFTVEENGQRNLYVNRQLAESFAARPVTLGTSQDEVGIVEQSKTGAPARVLMAKTNMDNRADSVAKVIDMAGSSKSAQKRPVAVLGYQLPGKKDKNKPIKYERMELHDGTVRIQTESPETMVIVVPKMNDFGGNEIQGLIVGDYYVPNFGSAEKRNAQIAQLTANLQKAESAGNEMEANQLRNEISSLELNAGSVETAQVSIMRSLPVRSATQDGVKSANIRVAQNIKFEGFSGASRMTVVENPDIEGLEVGDQIWSSPASSNDNVLLVQSRQAAERDDRLPFMQRDFKAAIVLGQLVNLDDSEKNIMITDLDASSPEGAKLTSIANSVTRYSPEMVGVLGKIGNFDQARVMEMVDRVTAFQNMVADSSTGQFKRADIQTALSTIMEAAESSPEFAEALVVAATPANESIGSPAVQRVEILDLDVSKMEPSEERGTLKAGALVQVKPESMPLIARAMDVDEATTGIIVQ
ncbi:MAG: hypothetical protein K8I00_00695, partial [Candidatus Omnitrophica bacterium]|nr:hypothetical protein [Candidatus Omnitrophota bacterium]